MTIESVMVRLGRRGVLTIVAEDGNFDVTLKAPGPYQGRGWCTTDEADFWSHCYLGATNWHGEGPDLDALITECEDTTRPRHRDVDDLRWAVEHRRDARTYGPPLPSYRMLGGWRPGDQRWLRSSDHAHEYLGGYERDRAMEHAEIDRRAEADRRQRQREARRILGGAA